MRSLTFLFGEYMSDNFSFIHSYNKHQRSQHNSHLYMMQVRANASEDIQYSGSILMNNLFEADMYIPVILF